MRVRIKTHGHQYYNAVEGEVIAWTTMMTRCHDQGGKLMQVPAVLLRTEHEFHGKRIELVPLQGERTHTDPIEVLSE